MLLHRWTAEWLQRACETSEGVPLPAVEPPPTEAGAARGAVEVLCECKAQKLLVIGFATAALHLCELRCEADGSEAQLAPLPALTLTLPAPALAVETSDSGGLCVLVPGELLVFPPSATRGFEQTPVRVPLGFTLASAASANAADEPVPAEPVK